MVLNTNNMPKTVHTPDLLPICPVDPYIHCLPSPRARWLSCVNASSPCPAVTPVPHPVLSVLMNSTDLMLVPRNLASFLYPFLFVIDFSLVIKTCQFCLSHISHLAPFLLPPPSTRSCLTFPPDPWLSPPAPSLQCIPWGCSNVQTWIQHSVCPLQGLGWPPRLDTIAFVKTLLLGPTELVSFPNLALCLLTSREMRFCY